MNSRHLVLWGAAALSAFAMATPAAAGRCGHSYPVDAPTTLAKVARACNVSLSALREANTGVDPSYVTPGEHLAVPDEIETAADVPPGGADLGVGDSSHYTPVYQYAEYKEPPRSPSPAPSAYAASTNPYYFQASYGLAPAVEKPNLSYQKRSAERIRNAGLALAPASPVGLTPYRNAAPRSVSISARGTTAPAPLSGDDLSPLMECAVLRRQPDGKIAQVREFKPLAEGRDTPAHCQAVALRAPTSAFTRSGFEAMPSIVNFTVLKGYVSRVDAECVSLRGDDGNVWRVAVDRAPLEMLGKEATIWAEITDASSCGGLVMDRAVYAERAR